MNKDRRFGRRIAEPSSVEIIHELKVMALRQSLDAAQRREAEGAPLGDPAPGDRHAAPPAPGPA